MLIQVNQSVGNDFNVSRGTSTVDVGFQKSHGCPRLASPLSSSESCGCPRLAHSESCGCPRLAARLAVWEIKRPGHKMPGPKSPPVAASLCARAQTSLH